MPPAKAFLVWTCLGAAIAVPIVIAAKSPLLQWRQPVYIAAGFAGIVAMVAVLIQPLLVAGLLPALTGRRRSRAHRIGGVVLILAVIAHVAGLWITSPPDMIDALTFSAPTTFSPLGVISMWMLFAAASLALLRRHLPARVWRVGHTVSVALAALTAVAHAMLIEGTMGTLSKTALCLLVLAATAKAVLQFQPWRSLRLTRR